MYPECVGLLEFDIDEFVRAELKLSIVNVIWQPPESETYRVDQRNPVTQNWGAVSALNRWADRTDPGGLKRAAFYRKVWDERPRGQRIVVLEKIDRGQYLQMSRN